MRRSRFSTMVADRMLDLALKVLDDFLLVLIALYVVGCSVESSVSPRGSCFLESHLFRALCAVPTSRRDNRATQTIPVIGSSQEAARHQ